MAAGTGITVFRPKIRVADVGSVLPALSLAQGAAWPAAWKIIPHTEEGLVITPSAPKDDINSDEAGGSIAVVPAGGAEINMSFTPLTPDLDLFSWLASMKTTTRTASNEVVTLEVTAGATTSANVTTTLNGVGVTTAVLNTDTAASQVATKIRATAFTGWTTGGSGTTVTFTKTATGASTSAPTFSGGTTGATGTIAVTSGYYPDHKQLQLQPEGRQFMIGVEGEVDRGGLLDKGGFVRVFGYKVEQTDEVEINMRRTGEDSAMRVAANVRCLNTVVTTTQTLGTGINNPDTRFDLFSVENAV
jgi:hypothetical protein